MSNDERHRRDIERDRINDAMAKIVSDTAGEPQPENKNNNRDQELRQVGKTFESARPRKITYVPIDESEFEPIVIPKRKSIRH